MLVELSAFVQLDGAPFKKCSKSGKVTDRSGEHVRIHPGAQIALAEIATNPAFADTKVAYASRTDCEDWAHTCLDLIHVIEGKLSLRDAAQYFEIFKGNKVRTNHC